MRDWLYTAHVTSALPSDMVLVHAQKNLATAIGSTWRPVGPLKVDCRPGDDLLSTKYTFTQTLELVPVSPS